MVIIPEVRQHLTRRGRARPGALLDFNAKYSDTLLAGAKAQSDTDFKREPLYHHGRLHVGDVLRREHFDRQLVSLHIN